MKLSSLLNKTNPMNKSPQDYEVSYADIYMRKQNWLKVIPIVCIVILALWFIGSVGAIVSNLR